MALKLKQFINIEWKNHERLSCKRQNFKKWLCNTNSVSLFLHDKVGKEIYFKEISSSNNSHGFLREAIVYRSNKPLIYAQTQFPIELTNKLTGLAELGDNSLGEFLIQNDQFFKKDMSFGYLKQFQQLPAEIQKNQEINKCDLLICRHSILAICGYKAELVEVFLPEFEKLFF